MTVKELKEALKDVSDSMQVLIPRNGIFDGAFVSPCTVDSDVTSMCVEDVSKDEIETMENLGQEIPETEFFVLVPCGFYDEKDHMHELN